MNRQWSDESLAFADSIGSALSRLGGVDFVRRAELSPSLRISELAPVLNNLGFTEIDALASPADAMVAAAAARAAGAVVMPWPVAARLAAPGASESGPEAVYLVHGTPRRLEHADLAEGAVALDLRTRTARDVRLTGELRAMPLDPFGVPCELGPDRGWPATSERLSRAVDAYILFSAYYVLGALERAADLAALYATERQQFGQPIGKFGAIQWRLSDLWLAREGFAEMAQYTLSQFCRKATTPADTIALRLTMQEAASSVLANSHQVLGAIGLCEEHDLAVIDRHLQPLLRRAGGVAVTTDVLRGEVLNHGFDALFPLKPKGADRDEIVAVDTPPLDAINI